MDTLFPDSYETSRARFIRDVELLRPKWHSSRLESYPLKTDPSLSIDYAWAEPRKKENLIIISTGLHGIEGYVGSGILKIFMDEFAPRLNIENTGILLVHAINPWGMKNHRRVNENNVDLNRNFVWDENFDPKLNPDYEQLIPILNPPRPLSNVFLNSMAYYLRFISLYLRIEFSKIRLGMIFGQYRHPQGASFGGQTTQESTQFMRGLLQKTLEEYEQVIHLDLHTGYGPRYQMSFYNSTREPALASELMKRFNYPLIVSGTTSNFYTTTGDIGDYFYQLRDEKYPAKKLFSTCFEFGTFGDSILAQIRIGRAFMMENRMFQFGTKSEAARHAVKNEYEEMYFPVETKWREKAIQDCRQAFEGIFSAYGIFSAAK